MEITKRNMNDEYDDECDDAEVMGRDPNSVGGEGREGLFID